MFETQGIEGWGYSNLIDMFLEFDPQQNKNYKTLILCMKEHNIIYEELEESGYGMAFSLLSRNPVYCLMEAFGISRDHYDK